MLAEITLAVLGGVVTVGGLYHCYRYFCGLQEIKKNLAHFSYVAEYDAYLDAQPQFFVTQPKQPYGVLFLHGFCVSAQVFAPILDELRKENINFYAITFTGYGMQCPNLLEVVRYQDWLRDAIRAYDVLAQTVEKVHVVGSSLGCAQAMILSRYREVDKMVQLSPAMYLELEFKWFVRLAGVPIIRNLLCWLYPFYTKKFCRDRKTRLDLCSVHSAKTTFNAATFPIHVGRAVEKTLKHVDFVLARFNELAVLYGKQDQVVNIAVYLKRLEKFHIKYVSKSYENSAHLITMDYDSEQVTRDVISFLQTAKINT